MSWFARSIANSLRFDDDDDQQPRERNTTILERESSDDSPLPPPQSSPRGVKDDLSEITKTLTRQLWGVASFLAPPSSAVVADGRSPAAEDVVEGSEGAGIGGIRSDFAEIGGRFRSGISKLSSNAAVMEITKIASDFLQFAAEEEDFGAVGGAVGVTEEVVAFVRDIAMHPETWLDFPLPDEDEDDDDDDFDMSDAQQEHALAVERFAPRLAALRIELCPGHMSENCFWKIYFVLLHPRLSRHDAELLSTPQVVKARALLTEELQNRRRGTSHSKDVSNSAHEDHPYVPSDAQFDSVPLEASPIAVATSVGEADFETDKHTIPSTEIQIIDKSVVEEGPVNWTNDQSSHSDFSRIQEEKSEDDCDDWLKEENSEIVNSGTTIPIENDEDVSFSDLEDDDEDVPTSYKKVTSGSDSSTKDSRDWVQLSRSSGDSPKDIVAVSVEHTGSEQVGARNPKRKESNDWLNVDDIDVV